MIKISVIRLLSLLLIVGMQLQAYAGFVGFDVNIPAETGKVVDEAFRKIDMLNKTVTEFNRNFSAAVEVTKNINTTVKDGFNELMNNPKFQAALELAGEIKSGKFERQLLGTGEDLLQLTGLNMDRWLNTIVLKLIGGASIAMGLTILYHLMVTPQEKQPETAARDGAKIKKKKMGKQEHLKKLVRKLLPPIVGVVLATTGLALILKARQISAAIT